MQQLLALAAVSLILLVVSPASAFQIQIQSVTHQQHRHCSKHAQQPLAATPKNDSDVSNTNNPLHSRRNMLGLAKNLAFLSACASNANADVLRSAGCANGEGEACADLAEGNEFIQNLQKKSAQNKEANQRVRNISLLHIIRGFPVCMCLNISQKFTFNLINDTTTQKFTFTMINDTTTQPTSKIIRRQEALNAYYMKNYPDFFAAASEKKMVKKLDGSFALLSAKEVDNLNKEGKIRIEYPTSKGGRIADLTQKPILVLNE